MWSADGMPMPVGAPHHRPPRCRAAAGLLLPPTVGVSRAAGRLRPAVGPVERPGEGDGHRAAASFVPLSKLYVEVRSDGCPPARRGAGVDRMYVGLLERLPEIHELVVERTPYAFWCQLFEAAERAPPTR